MPVTREKITHTAKRLGQHKIIFLYLAVSAGGCIGGLILTAIACMAFFNPGAIGMTSEQGYQTGVPVAVISILLQVASVIASKLGSNEVDLMDIEDEIKETQS